ncbi:MAG: hypothetical protein LBH17_03000 [Oscillospiraceae bacterium]|nr:hypothetical protein [Oscillospiraceae bacterium]
MTEQIMSVEALQTYLITMFPAQQVRVRRRDSVVTIEPAGEEADCTIALRGMFKDCPDMSVDRFLERKHADKELDL